MTTAGQTSPIAMPEAQPITAADITPADMPAPTSAAPKTNLQGGTAPSGDHTPAPAGSTPAPAPTSAEVDSRGVPFDPARHLPRKHPIGGQWMPKGGRKPKVAKPAPAPTPEAARQASPVESFIPPDVPPAEQPAAAERAPDAHAEIVDHSEDAAEVVCRAAQFGAGIVLDAPEDVTPAPAEHKSMTKATAAYIRTKGWQATAGVALFLVFAAWILRVVNKPRPREKIRGWLKLDGQPAGPSPASQADAAPSKSTAADAPRTAVPALPSGIPPLAQP